MCNSTNIYLLTEINEGHQLESVEHIDNADHGNHSAVNKITRRRTCMHNRPSEDSS